MGASQASRSDRAACCDLNISERAKLQIQRVQESCPAGHPLVEVVTEHNHAFCTDCRSFFPAGTRILHCHQCHYDRCLSCLNSQKDYMGTARFLFPKQPPEFTEPDREPTIRHNAPPLQGIVSDIFDNSADCMDWSVLETAGRPEALTLDAVGTDFLAWLKDHDKAKQEEKVVALEAPSNHGHVNESENEELGLDHPLSVDTSDLAVDRFLSTNSDGLKQEERIRTRRDSDLTKASSMSAVTTSYASSRIEVGKMKASQRRSVSTILSEYPSGFKDNLVQFLAAWFDPNSYTLGKGNEVKQAFYPVYLLCHCGFAMVLWLALSLAGSGRDGDAWYRRTAGLYSVPAFAGSTLTLHLLDGTDVRLEIWRPIAYQFTHVNYRHVLRNLTVICLVGIPQEGMHGHSRMGLIFNLGVLGAAFCIAMTDCHAECLGMSGGCYTLLGLKAMNLLLLWIDGVGKYLKLQLMFLLIIIAADSACAQFDIASCGDGPRPSLFLHIGGFVTGLVIGVVLALDHLNKYLTNKCYAVIVFIFLAVIIFGLAWTIKWPPQTIFESQGWRWAKRVQNAEFFGDLHWHCVRCGSEECIDGWSDFPYVIDTTVQWCDDNDGSRFTEKWPGK